MTKQKSMGFIEFDDQGTDQDAWRSHTNTEGKIYVAQGTRCHERHPDLPMGNGIIVGGNCNNHTRHSSVDLYVALDSYQSHPLFEIDMEPSTSFYYPIMNMGIPKRVDKFQAMVGLICHHLHAGKKVHVGCIGGHGRTGMVLAAVASQMGVCGPENDAIGWIRANYCRKAIETKAQEGFIVVNFGAKVQTASKTPYQVDKLPKGR